MSSDHDPFPANNVQASSEQSHFWDYTHSLNMVKTQDLHALLFSVLSVLSRTPLLSIPVVQRRFPYQLPVSSNNIPRNMPNVFLQTCDINVAYINYVSPYVNK